MLYPIDLPTLLTVVTKCSIEEFDNPDGPADILRTPSMCLYYALALKKSVYKVKIKEFIPSNKKCMMVEFNQKFIQDNLFMCFIYRMISYL